ncbi:Gldg family protein [Kistimonas asteriae]|uniref:Gldg family protein n=1 Tax=Kistimonas asteriae TaxID=517724 RepID=UPI001BA85535|nr:Gldg family protein [Kistimonas asteriae]
MTNKLFSKTGLVALAVLVLLATVAVQMVFRGARVDLTEDHLYTLSQGTRNLMQDLQEPVTLKLFYSRKATEGIPQLRNYANRVEELLREYAQVSGGKVTLEVIDPEPFSEQEDEAAGYGLQAVPLSMGSKDVYFGLVALSGDTSGGETVSTTEKLSEPAATDRGRQEIIGFFHPDKERFLEYDISNLIYSVGQKTRPKVAVISGVPVNGGYDYMTRRPGQSWMSITQLEQLYDVQYLGNTIKTIPDDVGLLVLILPDEVSDDTLYAIDQYVLKGGHALVFLDPHAEESAQGGGMMGGGSGPRSAYLDTLLSVWGVEMVPDRFVADEDHALAVGGQSGRPVRHLGILGLGENNFAPDDVVTANLKTVNVASAGALKLKDNATVRMEPLIQSGIHSALLDSAQLATLHDPKVLYKDYMPAGERYVLAARITGDVKTAFPEGRPQPKGDEQDDEHAPLDVISESVVEDQSLPTGVTVSEEEEEEVVEGESNDVAEEKPQIMTSQKPVNLIVVADTDVLSNRLWVQVNNFFGQQMATPFANNGDMVVNMVDNLIGNADLISIRSRGQYSRPFTRVDALEREAQASLMNKEEALTQQLQETENKLLELQAGKQGQDALILSEDQQKALARFQQEKLKIRKELRDVQHQLNQDIENLGTRLKLINIFAVPLLLTIIVIGLRIRQTRRQH